MSVIVWKDPTNKRSRVVCDSLNFPIRNSHEYKYPESDVAIFYGLSEQSKKIKRDYESQGLKTVYIDGGFWKRSRNWRDVHGYYKTSVDSFQCEHMIDVYVSSDRFDLLNLTKSPYQKKSGHILLIGLPVKSTQAYNTSFESWETGIVEQIRKITDRKIIYRQKITSEKHMTNIADYISKQSEEPIDALLSRVSFVVTRHSNIAMDALLNGIPFYTEHGLTKKWSTPLPEIDNPKFPDEDERQMILNRAAYSQWSIKEMQSGKAWNFLRRFCEKG